MRSFKIDVKNIFFDTESACPRQEILTRAAIAKNQGPRATTGFPPALAMAGRCGVLAGNSQTAFNHDPEIDDSIMEINNNMRNIANERNAIISPKQITPFAPCYPDRHLVYFWVIFSWGSRFELHLVNHGRAPIGRLP